MAKSSNVYCFTMNKGASGNRLIIKAICIALTLTFGVSIVATGVMANAGCGLKCCCLSQPITQHHAPQEQIRSSMGCCNQTPLFPCDIASGNKLELHGINLACTNCSLTDAAAAAAILSDKFIDLYGFRGHEFDQFTQEKFRSPPLYLQNLSFLI
jgi:hypothetical protein